VTCIQREVGGESRTVVNARLHTGDDDGGLPAHPALGTVPAFPPNEDQVP